MKKILLLFTHPKYEFSRANKALLQNIPEMDGLTFHDLYERYPDFNIDIDAEKELLKQHDIIVWHHPFYWYSCPPLMKQWIDLVLEFGWAYGPGGNALEGKWCFNAITTGSSLQNYCQDGMHQCSFHEFLKPFEQTAKLCGMHYLPPFAVMGTVQMDAKDLAQYEVQYRKLLHFLQHTDSLIQPEQLAFLNEAVALIQS